MSINVQKRAKLLRETLGGITPGNQIRCSGVDDPDLCSNLKKRDSDECDGCGAMNLVEPFIPVSLVGKGVIRRERSSF